MAAITITHDLSAQTKAADHGDAGRPVSRSPYGYLFRGLADAADAGVFTGTDEPATVARLKQFEIAARPPWVPAPALRMQLAAVYTYFGQFVNHDISAPIGGLLINIGQVPPAGIIGTVDPAGVGKEWRSDTATILAHFVNEQAAPLTLASLYGDGPHSPDVAAFYQPGGTRFRLAQVSVAPKTLFTDLEVDPASVHHARAAPDMPRRDGLPLIADQRNDGNLIISQLHLAFMRVHNKAVTALERRDPHSAGFAEARQEVTLLYHWLILNDLLPNLLSKSVQARPLSHWQPRHSDPGTVPMEFTTAAFRFGHSMVGRAYDFNANFGRGGSMAAAASLGQLFAFTSHGGMGGAGGPARQPDQLPDHWVIDWHRMSAAPKAAEAKGADGAAGDGAERIDLGFAPDMLNVAGAAPVAEHGSIMFRNLLRGFHRRIPFGQVLAEACDVAPLTPAQVLAAMPRQQHEPPGTNALGDVARRLGIDRQTPAWLYFLCEAQVLEDGQRIGPTASQIIADTIVGLMRHTPASILRHGGGWQPRDGVLRNKDGRPIDSIRAFVLFSTEPDP